jgi:hypothetical protein
MYLWDEVVRGKAWLQFSLRHQGYSLGLLLCCGPSVRPCLALLPSMAEAGFVPVTCYFLNLVTSTGKQGKPYN